MWYYIAETKFASWSVSLCCLTKAAEKKVESSTFPPVTSCKVDSKFETEDTSQVLSSTTDVVRTGSSPMTSISLKNTAAAIESPIWSSIMYTA